jgi:hypothetical protein
MAGMVATVNGIAYQANWWTQSNDLGGNSGAAGSDEPWTVVPNAWVPAAPTGLTASAITTTTTTLQSLQSPYPDRFPRLPRTDLTSAGHNCASLSSFRGVPTAVAVSYIAISNVLLPWWIK